MKKALVVLLTILMLFSLFQGVENDVNVIGICKAESSVVNKVSQKLIILYVGKTLL